MSKETRDPGAGHDFFDWFKLKEYKSDAEMVLDHKINQAIRSLVGQGFNQLTWEQQGDEDFEEVMETVIVVECSDLSYEVTGWEIQKRFEKMFPEKPNKKSIVGEYELVVSGDTLTFPKWPGVRETVDDFWDAVGSWDTGVVSANEEGEFIAYEGFFYHLPDNFFNMLGDGDVTVTKAHSVYNANNQEFKKWYFKISEDAYDTRKFILMAEKYEKLRAYFDKVFHTLKEDWIELAKGAYSGWSEEDPEDEGLDGFDWDCSSDNIMSWDISTRRGCNYPILSMVVLNTPYYDVELEVVLDEDVMSKFKQKVVW